MELYIKDEHSEKRKVKTVYVCKNGAPVRVEEGTPLYCAVIEYAQMRGVPVEVQV